LRGCIGIPFSRRHGVEGQLLQTSGVRRQASVVRNVNSVARSKFLLPDT
jgi:hypothetical protein